MPGAFRTKADLVNAVIGNLGGLAIGQAPNVEDVAMVSGEIDSMLRMFAALDIVYIADADNIPGAVFSPLADMIAGELANDWGKSDGDFAQLISRGLGVPPGSGSAAMALKQMNRGRPTYEALRVQYF